MAVSSRSDRLRFHDLALEWSSRIILGVKSPRRQGRHEKMTPVAGLAQVQIMVLFPVHDLNDRQYLLHS